MKKRPKDFGLYEASREHDACGIGAVVNISGIRNHDILRHARQIIESLQHRGASGSDESTGDGGGVLLQIPHDFLMEECKSDTIELPAPGEYGVGMIFLPKHSRLAERARAIIEKTVVHYGMSILGWRDVPVDSSCLGTIAREGEPAVRQLFVHGNGLTDVALERKLFLARKRIGNDLIDAGTDFDDAYVCSLSGRTICYKGMFLSPQLFKYYSDLRNERVVSALAIVHQRYSTNTFPSWRLAQPFRMCAHNGEINTLRGNVNRIAAAQSSLECPELGDDLNDLGPLLNPNQSDSACFDNIAELLTMAGRSLPHSIMMMMPEAFGPRYHISTDKRTFYEYHAGIMQPWDGPSAMVFTDGKLLGGTLDRNGLRPCRYVITKDDLVVMASETGVIDVPPDRVLAKGRLQPGKMFLVDTVEGRIITDNEIKSRISRQKPYRRWLEQNRIELKGAYVSEKTVPLPDAELVKKLRMFGYTREDLHVLLKPMGRNGQEPIGSMGNDTPLAVLSDKPRQVFHYFKQLFAQVTNPPIDPLREGLVMSLMGFGGKSRNLLTESPEHCRQLKLPHPILTNEEMTRLRQEPIDDFKITTLDATFDGRPVNPAKVLRNALEELIEDAEAAIRNGASMLIISDRKADKDRAPIPCLLATGAVHHGLLRKGVRGQVDLIIESGEIREVQHFCLLAG